MACILMDHPGGIEVMEEIEENRAARAKSRCKIVGIIVSYLKEWVQGKQANHMTPLIQEHWKNFAPL